MKGMDCHLRMFARNTQLPTLSTIEVSRWFLNADLLFAGHNFDVCLDRYAKRTFFIVTELWATCLQVQHQGSTQADQAYLRRPLGWHTTTSLAFMSNSLTWCESMLKLGIVTFEPAVHAKD